jgi:hypothetical protein
MGSMRNVIANLNNFLQELRALATGNLIQRFGDDFAFKQ